MAHYNKKTPKSQAQDKTLYTLYYPNPIPNEQRYWSQDYFQCVAVDPAIKNLALRIERRYKTGKKIPLVFDKVAVEASVIDDNMTMCTTYQEITKFLDKYKQFYQDCHMIVIERQLIENYKMIRVSQHIISYFLNELKDSHLFPYIFEIAPTLKTQALKAPKGINKKQVKTWAIGEARRILTERNDEFSLQVLNYFKNKQDDLSDCVVELEALWVYLESKEELCSIKEILMYFTDLKNASLTQSYNILPNSLSIYPNQSNNISPTSVSIYPNQSNNISPTSPSIYPNQSNKISPTLLSIHSNQSNNVYPNQTNNISLSIHPNQPNNVYPNRSNNISLSTQSQKPLTIQPSTPLVTQLSTPSSIQLQPLKLSIQPVSGIQLNIVPNNK